MELTGILIGILIAGWLLFLVPMLSKGEIIEEEERPEDQQPDSNLIVIHYGAAKNGVSSPADREQAIARIRAVDRRAAARRRRVMIALFLLLVAVFIAATWGYLPWFMTGIPSMLLVLFLGIARVSVKKMRAQLQTQMAAVLVSNEEETICLDLNQAVEQEVQISYPVVEKKSSLLDPLPITKPTYISKAIGPRTVRTVDLSYHKTEAPVTLTQDDYEPTVDIPSLTTKASTEAAS